MRIDSILSPIESIDEGLGPMNPIDSSASRFAKPEFSERNPYPGCTACAPLQKSMMKNQ